MGCPGSCPHGNPILPPGEMPVPEPGRARLRDVPSGETVELIRISELAEEQHDLIEYFEVKGFRPGGRIAVLDRAPLNGPITVALGGERLALGEDLAGYLWVRPTHGRASDRDDETLAGRR